MDGQDSCRGHLPLHLCRSACTNSLCITTQTQAPLFRMKTMSMFLITHNNWFCSILAPSLYSYPCLPQLHTFGPGQAHPWWLTARCLPQSRAGASFAHETHHRPPPHTTTATTITITPKAPRGETKSNDSKALFTNTRLSPCDPHRWMASAPQSLSTSPSRQPSTAGGPIEHTTANGCWQGLCIRHPAPERFWHHKSQRKHWNTCWP